MKTETPKRSTIARSAFLTVFLCLPAITSLIGATADNQRKVRDAFGNLVWASDSNFSAFGLLFLQIYLVIASLIFLMRLRDRRNGPSNFGIHLFAWPLALLIGSASRFELRILLDLLVATAVLGVLARDGISNTEIRLGARVSWILVMFVPTFALLNPSRGFIDCRPEKCSPIGQVLVGFFPQENTLGIYCLSIFAISLLAFRGAERFILVTTIGSIIILTGSRIAIIAMAFALVAIYLRKQSSSRTFKLSLVAMVWLMFIASFGLFFARGNFGNLTGRGEIWAVLEQAFWNAPLFGPGRNVLSESFFNSSAITYSVAHEHGQVPYVLTNGGVVGLVAFVLFLSMFLKRYRDRLTSLNSDGLILLATISILFATEPVMQIDTKTPGFALLALLYALVGQELSSPDKANLGILGEQNAK